MDPSRPPKKIGVPADLQNDRAQTGFGFKDLKLLTPGLLLLSLHVLNAVLSIVVGLMLIRHPLAGALVMALLLAAYFTVAGIFRIVAALSMRIRGWGWALADGIITLILGILVWAQWPVSGLWIIGLFIGIDLIVVGWSEVMLAVAARSLRLETT